jgi:phospholipase/carboxylesterase
VTEELAGYAYAYEAGSAPDAPVLLLLHGTGGDERQLQGLGRMLAPDAPRLAPRGNVVERDEVPRFFKRIPTGDGSAYPFTFDDAEVTRRAGDMAAFVEAALDRHDLRARPVVAAGFSNGANLATVLLLTRPGLLRGAVAIAPMPVLDDPPTADLSSSAALLASGRADPIATPEKVEELASTLADRGAGVEVHWHDGGHDIGPSTVAAARSWLDKLRQAIAVDPLP